MDIGAGEFIALAIVALIVLGPEKLPRYAADAARMLRTVRKMANDARSEVRRELGPELGDLDFSDLTPRGLVRKHLLEPIDIDDLDEFGGSDATNGAASSKPAARRGPGPAPGGSDGSSAPARPTYDEDAT